MRAYKFNIHWQLVRVNARKLKDVATKAAYVVGWYNDNMNAHNYNRVHNWLLMTAYAYKDEKRAYLNKQAEDLVESLSMTDLTNNLNDVSMDDAVRVYKDLSKRKGDFIYKGLPKAHIEFMLELEKYIG